MYVSDGSWSWIRWYVVNDSRKQQVLVVAQSFLDRLGHLGPVELARDQCGKDRDAKCATEVYGHGPSHQCSRHFQQRCQYMASSIVACLEGAFRAIFSDPHTFGLKLTSKDRRVTFCILLCFAFATTSSWQKILLAPLSFAHVGRCQRNGMSGSLQANLSPRPIRSNFFTLPLCVLCNVTPLLAV